MDKIEMLYKNYGVLAEAKDNITQHEDLYIEILDAIKGNGKEKKLASQFISKFYIHFPHLIEESFRALLLLLDDEDITTRKQVIKDLPMFCKGGGDQASIRISRVADELAQVLGTAEDAGEFNVIHNSMTAIFKIDAIHTIQGIFNQILNGDDSIREKCLKYLNNKFKVLGESWSKEIEECVLEQCKKVLADVTATEFIAVMQLLSGLNISKTVSGQQQIVDILINQAELNIDKPFEYSDPDNVDRLIQCGRRALPFFSCMVHSAQFFSYISQQVLPVMSSMKPTMVEGIEDVQLEIFKLLAEMSINSGNIDKSSKIIEIVFKKLQEFMPLPPAEENIENSLNQDFPKLNFSYVECLMFTFHQLGKTNPEFLTEDSNSEIVKDFKLRLQYFSRGMQFYLKNLKESIQAIKQEEAKSEENNYKLRALKTINNINTLIKDLFHSPPSYKTKINLSWKPLGVNNKQSLPVREKNGKTPVAPTTEGVKRHTPITFEDDGASKTKKMATSINNNKTSRQLYTPPSGKYSTGVRNFSFPRGQRGGRGRGRGGSRGRGNVYFN